MKESRHRVSREVLLSKIIETLPYLTDRECLLTCQMLDYFRSVSIEVLEEVEE